MENKLQDDKKKKLTIIIIVSVVVLFIISATVLIFFVGVVLFTLSNYSGTYENDYYKIEVGATVSNFSGKYVPLFMVMDKNSDGELSHSEVLDFYNNTVVTKKDHADIFMYEDGKWTVSEGLKDAALEYYTQGKIITPELNEKYNGYFNGINSGVDEK